MSRPRSLEQRKRDALDRLARDVDAWVATADPTSGTPYLVPLSFLWDDATMLIATPASSQASRNLQATGKVRGGLGPTRDVVVIEGTTHTPDARDVPSDMGEAFAAATGFDPRTLTTRQLSFRIHPRRMRAWRAADELEGRELMRSGRWLEA